jgi:hypothetical protein
MIRKGDHLKVRPEWLDKGEDGLIVYVAVEDEYDGRVMVQALIGWENGIVGNPVTVVRSECFQPESE